MKEIILKFDLTTGEVKVEASGFKGSSCREATEFLKSLGQETNFQRKLEWFEENLRIAGKLNSNLCG